MLSDLLYAPAGTGEAVYLAALDTRPGSKARRACGLVLLKNVGPDPFEDLARALGVDQALGDPDTEPEGELVVLPFRPEFQAALAGADPAHVPKTPLWSLHPALVDLAGRAQKAGAVVYVAYMP